MAENLNEFVLKCSEAIRTALNTTEIGQELTGKLLKESLNKNPGMTQEEWAEIKSQFMTFLFCQTVTANPDLMDELAVHTYNEIRKTEEMQWLNLSKKPWSK